MKRLLFLMTLACALTIMMASAAASDRMISYAKYGQKYAKYGSVPDGDGMCSYGAIDKKDYSGKTLTVISNAVPVIGEPTILHARQFEDLTGANVEVVNVPFGDLYQRIMIPFQTGQPAYDVMFYGSLWIGDFHKYLATVPKKYRQTELMQDVTENYMDMAMWGDRMVQYPIDGDRFYIRGREAVFSSPKMAKKYKKATGRTLGLPDTWKEFNQIAKFFSGWDWDGDGKKEYGAAEITKRNNLMFSAFIARVAPYAKNPHVDGGFYFDLDTMEPQVNKPGWVKGLKMFVKAKKGWPPGGASFTLGDTIFAYGGGQVAMAYAWDDPLIQAQERGSPIRNKSIVGPMPGSHKVWNRVTQKWEHFDKLNRPAYIVWGWTSAVAKSSNTKQMAFDYLCFFSNKPNTTLDLQIGRFGINPYRYTYYDADFWINKLGWDPALAKSYVNTIASIAHSDNRVFDLRVPGVNQFMSTMAYGVAQALAGRKSPQEALDAVAKKWSDIVHRIGVDRVRKAYANVVELENR